MYSTFQLAKKYFSYYISSSNGKGHGVHSPFVFDFIKFVLNDKKKYKAYDIIEARRKSLLADGRSIEVEDFGAGSSVIKSNTRVVSKMAASSLKPKKFAQLLYRIAAYYKPGSIVELGTSFGITTSYLASGHPSAKIYTLEGSSAIAGIAQQSFDQFGLQQIQLIQGDFAHTFPDLLEKLPAVGLGFVDGNHRKKPTLEYFYHLLGHSTESTILIFDDIHWSSEMEQAWEEIKKQDAVTLSIDLFFIGIVFLRKDFKVKQHFSIRF